MSHGLLLDCLKPHVSVLRQHGRRNSRQGILAERLRNALEKILVLDLAAKFWQLLVLISLDQLGERRSSCVVRRQERFSVHCPLNVAGPSLGGRARLEGLAL